jgi:hypothetical protein
MDTEETVNNCFATEVRVLSEGRRFKRSNPRGVCGEVRELTMQILITSPPTIIPTKM